ncbi:hypothetical protein BU16DRAFT_293923 [Lophium mytilinum]|uniref:Rhodopsin domain-containing protein n=1 Tax=Lophium mytilinum TaxID=390894 RepID=A0A6A6R147_9PEZI|nr:hypothetical protein BU16DRAFT_293923 [Lophium mytilinum]
MNLGGSSQSLLAVSVLFLILTWISTVGRIYVRKFMLNSLATDDYLAAVSLVSFTIFAAFAIQGTRYGLGDFLPHSTPVWVQVAQLKWFLLSTLVYLITISILKVSIGYTLLRFAPTKRYRITIYVCMIVTAIVGIFYFFFLLLECTPTYLFWTTLAQDKNCRDPRIAGGAAYVLSAVNALTDWVFGILPIAIVWKLNMSFWKKTLVSGILALGIAASIATLLRISSIVIFTQPTKDPEPNGIGGIVLWSIIEPGIGLTAISLAAIRPLIATFSSRFRSALSSDQKTEANSRTEIRVRTDFELLEEGADGRSSRNKSSKNVAVSNDAEYDVSESSERGRRPSRVYEPV